MRNLPLLVIDRFESNFAVVEHEGLFFNIPRNLIPADANEGDVLCMVVTLDSEETERRRQAARRLLDELME